MAYIGQKPLPVSTGGTGNATLTNHSVLVGAAGAPITPITVGTTGQLLRGNTGADPSFASVSPGNFTFTSATAGTMRTLGVSNTDNTNTGSSGTFSVAVGGPNGGDPMLQHVITGATTWSQGIDNSVTTPEADPYVISSGTTLGTNNVMVIQPSGPISYPLQSAFLAFLGTTVNNVTANGGTYTLGTTGGTALTKVYDQHNDLNTNGTYTCPVTSKVDLRAFIRVTGHTIATTFTISIVTTARTYQSIFTRPAASTDQTVYISCIADMAAGNTATVTLVATGEAGNTDDITGNATT